MTAPVALTAYELAARDFEPPSARPRKWATPGDMAVALDPGYKLSPVLDLIHAELAALIDGDGPENALAVFCPPQEGKSEACSRRLPEWALSHDTKLRIAIVSYELDLAVRWGRAIRRDTRQYSDQLEVSIRPDSSAAGRWETPQGGGVYCVGIGGSLTGKPVDLLIIDDPVKDRAEAESEAMRKRAWDWWENVALPRLAGNAKVVLVQTRWHEDDLSGRIFSRPQTLTWRQVVIPAIATSPDDALGRVPGEEMPSVRGRQPGYFHMMRAGMSNYVFSSIYQQNPTAAEGNFFRRAAFRYWRPLKAWSDGRERIDLEGQVVTLADCWIFATIDVAASTKTSADFTVCSVWAITLSGDLVLLDRRRAQVATHDHFAMVRPLHARWRFQTAYVEKQFFSTTLVKDARAAGIPVAEVVADTDKVTRAIPAAGRVHAGRAWFPAETSGCQCGNCKNGVWLDEWCDELASFPTGSHDDQVDTLSYAARVQVADWSPAAPPPSRSAVSEVDRGIAMAHHAATGNGHHEVDYLNEPW